MAALAALESKLADFIESAIHHKNNHSSETNKHTTEAFTALKITSAGCLSRSWR